MCVCDLINYLWALLLLSGIAVILLANYDAYMDDDENKSATEILVSKSFRSNRLRLLIVIFVFIVTWTLVWMCIHATLRGTVRYAGNGVYTLASRVGNMAFNTSPTVFDPDRVNGEDVGDGVEATSNQSHSRFAMARYFAAMGRERARGSANWV